MENADPIFVRPPGTPRHPLGSLMGVLPTCTQGEKLVSGNTVDTVDEVSVSGYNINLEKENYEDAAPVLQVCQVAEGMGYGTGRG